MEKGELFKKVLESIQKNILELTESYESYRKQALDAPGAMQSHHDTLKREASYMAEKVVQRIAYMQKTADEIQKLDPAQTDEVSVGSVVTVVDKEKKEKKFIILPSGEGEVLHAEKDFFVISPASPLFTVMQKKKRGEAYIFNGKHYTVQSIV